MNDLEREILHEVHSHFGPYQVDPTEQFTLWHDAVRYLYDALVKVNVWLYPLVRGGEA